MGQFQELQLQLVSLSLSYFPVFSALMQDPSICLSFCFLLFSLCWPLEQQNQLHDKFFSYCWSTWGQIFWPGLGDLSISKSQRLIIITIIIISISISSSFRVFTSIITYNLHWSLNYSKSPQIYRTLLRILADLSTAMIWAALTLVLVSSSHRFFFSFFGIILRALTMIGITVRFMFHIFFNSLAKSKHLSSFALSIYFTLWSAGTRKSTSWQVIFFLLTIIRSGLEDLFLS